jgi:DNA mismatch repair protein MutS
MLIITGPNMAGKSTYIRQAALIVLMAQMGSFVPARRARIGVVDRIFTRIGSADEIARGRSTFLVEMNETANILNNASARSLIILDEIGRGTSTYDGISIAWAVAEDIAKRIGARTLFATHYHELTELAQRLPAVRNVHVSVREWGDRVIFVRTVKEGPTDRSYGIHVARLAGIPQVVVNRAWRILESLEKQTAKNRIGEEDESQKKTGLPAGQLMLFAPPAHRLVEQLKEIDINNITPLEALNLLKQLSTQAREE